MVLLVGLAAFAAGCADASEEDIEGPEAAGPGRQLLVVDYSLVGARQPVHDSQQVADPVSGGSSVSVRLRNLGDPASGNFYAATVNIGAGAAADIVLPAASGALKLYLQRDRTMALVPDIGQMVAFEIPSVEDGPVEFTAQVERLVLAGVYRLDLDITTTGGPATIEVSVAVQ